MDVKTGSGVIDCSSVASLVTTAMSLRKNRLLLSVSIVLFLTTEFLYIFPRQMDTCLYVALVWFGNILGQEKNTSSF
jgi:hypothetical protein